MQTPAWSPTPTDGSFLDVRDYARVVSRRRRLILVITGIAVGLAVAVTFAQVKEYTATAEVLVRQSAVTTNGAPAPILNVENERETLSSDEVASRAAILMGIDESPRDLWERLDVAIPKDADVLQVRFSDPVPNIAAQGAQAFAQAYLDYKTAQAQTELDRRARAISDRISGLRGQGGSQQAIALLEGSLADVQATTIDPGEILVDAVPPGSPTSPNLALNLGLALFLGLFVGLVAAFVRERMDDRLRGRTDLEETIGGPVMTVIPAVPSWSDRSKPYLVTLEAPRSPAAEAYRTLRTSVLVSAAQQGVKTLMVVSALAGEGKSTTAANLAVVLAQTEKRVVLISADLRRPRLHEFFGLSSNERGLSEVLSGDRRAWESLRSGKVEHLWIMSSGKISEQPTELLQSEAMRELLADQREVVDFILIDCPPVLAVADALVLAPMVDAVLYVADAESTPRGAVLQARAQLDQVGARLIGAVLNAAEGETGYAYYGGKHPYGHVEAASTNGKGSVWGQLRKDRSRS